MSLTNRFAAGFVLVAVVGLLVSVVSPAPARGAGSAPVTVVNTSNQPVPVALQGTGSVAGTVNAAQSGSWSVSVSNLPPVQFAPGASVGVSNTPTTPIYFSEVTARNAYVVELSDCTGAECPPSSVTLPVGSRFVIEHVSGLCGNFAALELKLNGQTNLHRLTPGNLAFSMPIKVYADGGVQDAITLINSIDENCHVSVSGYLIQMANF